jgi:hypothetical protein
MLGKKTLQARFPAFQSPKTVTPIPVRHSAIQDALIQSSLDPRVRSIGYVASAVVASQQVKLGAIVVQRDDVRFFLDVVPARGRVRDIDQLGLALIALEELGLKQMTIAAEELFREPLCTNARFVWLYNGYSVPRRLRERILRALSGKKSVPLRELERSVRSVGDPSNAVMSLVCADVLELDLIKQPIQQTTIVKAR